MKKRLSRQEEFEILKLVLDKFLWLGFGIMALGLYQIMTRTDALGYGFFTMLLGAVVLVLFIYLLVREYEIVR